MCGAGVERGDGMCGERRDGTRSWTAASDIQGKRDGSQEGWLEALKLEALKLKALKSWRLSLTNTRHPTSQHGTCEMALFWQRA